MIYLSINAFPINTHSFCILYVYCCLILSNVTWIEQKPLRSVNVCQQRPLIFQEKEHSESDTSKRKYLLSSIQEQNSADQSHVLRTVTFLQVSQYLFVKLKFMS